MESQREAGEDGCVGSVAKGYGKVVQTNYVKKDQPGMSQDQKPMVRRYKKRSKAKEENQYLLSG